MRLRVLVVPGLFGEDVAPLVAPFTAGLAHLEAAHGYRTGLIPVGGRSSTAENAGRIAARLAALPPDPAERLVLIGYSKGICDILEALVAHPPVRKRVHAVVSLAGSVGGSFLADTVPDPLEDLIGWLDLPGLDPGDGGGIASLRPAARRRWLADHRLPRSVRYYALPALPEPDRVSAILRPGWRRIADHDPLNDSQVVWTDALIPGATLLGFANGDHWAVALAITEDPPPVLRDLAAPLVDRNDYPRELLLEAVVRHIEEDLARHRLAGWWRRLRHELPALLRPAAS